jgi:hypothetical protein
MSNYRGAFAEIIAACVLDGRYMMSPEFLPDADCERCRFKPFASKGSHCYMFVEWPGDKCGQFRRRDDVLY